MEVVDYFDDSLDSCVQFDGCGEMFVPDSLGVLGFEDDVDASAAEADSACDMDFIVEDTYDKQEDIVAEEMAAAYEEADALCATVHEADDNNICFKSQQSADSACDMDFIVEDTYDKQEDIVAEEIHGTQLSSMQGEATPKQNLLPDLNLPATGDDERATEVNLDRDFDLNKLPIRGMFACKNDPFYEESFIQMLRILVPDFY